MHRAVFDLYTKCIPGSRIDCVDPYYIIFKLECTPSADVFPTFRLKITFYNTKLSVVYFYC